MDDSNSDNQFTPTSNPSTQAPGSVEPEAVAPPAPGQVVTAGSSAVPPAVPTVSAAPNPAANAGATGAVPPSQIITSNHGGGKKRWLKALLLLIIIALLAVGGWLAYQKHHKKAQAPATTASKDISLLKIGMQSADFGNLYPDMSVNDYGYTINAQMFEGLVRYEDKSKITPDLASDWKNPDSKTWIFTIKPGIKFHDGHTLAANDVKYSLDKVIASKSDLAETFASTIASVEVVGNNQVKISTTEPDPTLLNKLTFLYIIDANLPQGDEPSQAGTGPYEIKAGTKPTNTSVQMVAFNGYHGGRPTTKALAFGTEDGPDALLKAFQAHQYDLVGYIPSDKAKSAQGAYQFTTVETDTQFVGFNTVKAGPLQNKLVREAVRYAVSPTTIGKAGGSDVTPLSQMIPPSIPGYNPAIKPYKQDVAKAKQLLAQAGYPNGLALRLSVSSGTSPETINELVSELKQAGITATVDAHSNFDEFIDYFNGGQAEMFTVSYSSDTLDGLDIYNTTINSANYNNPKLTDLLSQANTTVDPAKRLKLLQDAAAIIDQDVAVVPLSTKTNLWLMNRPYVIKQDMPSSYLPVYLYKVHNQ